jgi:hypothetical protein
MIVKSQQATAAGSMDTLPTQGPADSDPLEFPEDELSRGRQIPWKWLFVAFVLVVAIGLAGPLNRLWSQFGKAPQDLVLYTVQRGDLADRRSPSEVTWRANRTSRSCARWTRFRDVGRVRARRSSG